MIITAKMARTNVGLYELKKAKEEEKAVNKRVKNLQKHAKKLSKQGKSFFYLPICDKDLKVKLQSFGFEFENVDGANYKISW